MSIRRMEFALRCARAGLLRIEHKRSLDKESDAKRDRPLSGLPVETKS